MSLQQFLLSSSIEEKMKTIFQSNLHSQNRDNIIDCFAPVALKNGLKERLPRNVHSAICQQEGKTYEIFIAKH